METDPLLKGSKGELKALGGDRGLGLPARVLFSSANKYPSENVVEHAVNDFYEAVVDDDVDAGDEDVLWLREQRSLNKTLHWAKRPSVVMVGFTIFSLAFAVASGESTRQMISFKLACNYLIKTKGTNMCDAKENQVVISNLQLAYNIANSISTMFASGKVGSLSDQYGRKPFICLIVVMFFVSRSARFAIMYTSPYLHFPLMVATEVTTNICGGVVTMVSLANCYITDVVEPHERIYSIGLVMASLFIGMLTGPLVGNFVGSFSKKYGDGGPKIGHGTLQMVDINKQEFLPFKFELCVFFFLVLFTIFVLPESRSLKARRKSRTLSRSSSHLLLEVAGQPEPLTLKERVKQALNFLLPLRLLVLPDEIVHPSNQHRVKKDRFAVIILIFIECTVSSLAMVLVEISILYGYYKFSWVSTDIGRLIAISCASKAFALLILSPILSHKLFGKYFGFRTLSKQIDMVDFSMILTALVFDAIGLLVMALASSTSRFYLSYIFTSVGSLCLPSISSSVIKFFPESKVGEVFGGIALIKNFFGVLTPVVLINLYKYALVHWDLPSLPFLTCLTVVLINSVLLLIAKRVLGLNKDLNPVILTRSNSTFSLSAPPEPRPSEGSSAKLAHSRKASMSSLKQKGFSRESDV